MVHAVDAAVLYAVAVVGVGVVVGWGVEKYHASCFVLVALLGATVLQ